jgi:hypothetical protein
MSLTKEQALIEYAKCIKSTPYALRTYLQTFDNTVQKFVPLDLFSDQVQLVDDYDNYEENIALKYRQAGVSTVTAAWSSKKIAFAKKEKPEKILIIANKLDTSVEFANKIKQFTEQWPDWMGVKFSPDKNAARHWKLTNGCEVKAVATSNDALRGYTPTVLIFDEAAYIEAGDDFWAACMASLSTGGKVIVISTPNGYDSIYYTIYDQSIKGMNNFKITEMYWWRDPRYTKGIEFIKVKDIIHYYLNREEYKDIEVVSFDNVPQNERNFDDFKKLMDDGYKPHSDWFEKMAKKLKFDRRKISQELECNFLGSGDNVFESHLIENIRTKMVANPISKMVQNQLWIWKEPQIGHKYIMGIDVSRGDSEDFTSFQIIDFEEREQVAEYLGKIPPDVAAEIAFKWAIYYDAFVVIDITGGMGVSTSRKMQELGYKKLYVDGVNYSNVWDFNPKAMEKIPGINFNSKRVQIISSFEEALRHGFKVYSTRLLNELNTFVYINGRPDHMKNHHDDLIMSVAMALYVGQNSYNQLEKVTEQTKAMLNSWEVLSNTEQQRKITDFNPGLPVMSPMNHNNNQFNTNPSRGDYEKYSWLFGK